LKITILVRLLKQIKNGLLIYLMIIFHWKLLTCSNWVKGLISPFLKIKKQSVIEFIKDFESTGFLGNNNQKLKIRNTVVTQLEKFMKNKQHDNNIHVELMRLLKITKSFFKDNTNIIFTKADKGNITVALDRAHYINSITEMLKDPLTYEVIQRNPVKNLEFKLNNILKRWVSLDLFLNKNYIHYETSIALCLRLMDFLSYTRKTYI